METNSDTIARTSLELAKRLVADGRPPIAISDVDQTLSHETRFDSRHNSHEPVFSADVIGCGRLTPLLLASARRANHPFSFAPWRVGLVPEEVPLILENGGIIARLAVGGVAAEPTGDMALHDEIHARVEEVHSTLRLPAELVVKHGLSMASLRLQNPDGSTLDHLHAELTEQVQNAIGDERIEVVNTGASVSVQERGISKLETALKILDAVGFDLQENCLVGLGDSPNDIPHLTGTDIGVVFGDKISVEGALTMPATPAAAAALLGTLVVVGEEIWAGL